MKLRIYKGYLEIECSDNPDEVMERIKTISVSSEEQV